MWSFHIESYQNCQPRLPRVGDLGGLAVGAGERARAPVGAEAAQVVALGLEAPLDDVLGIERRVGRVLAVLVDGQDLRDLADRVVGPVDLRCRRASCTCRRTRGAARLEAGLLEQARDVEQHRRVDRERDADLALVELVDVDGVGREARQVVAGRLDERREVQPLAVERVRAADADRPDDVGPVARGDLGREGVVGAGVRDGLEHEVDVRVARVEVLDDLLLDLDLLRGVAAAEAAEPADLGLAGLCRRGGLGAPAALSGAAEPAVLGAAVVVVPPQAPTTRASTPIAAKARIARICSSWSGTGTPPAGGRQRVGGRAPGSGAAGPVAAVSLLAGGADNDPLHVVARPVAPDVGTGELDRAAGPVERETFDEQRRPVRLDAQQLCLARRQRDRLERLAGADDRACRSGWPAARRGSRPRGRSRAGPGKRASGRNTCSRRSGSPSAMRSRSTCTTGAPTAMPSASAMAASAGSVRAVTTRVDGSWPRCWTSSVNDSVPSRSRSRGGRETNVPRPRARSMRRSRARSPSARRTVIRLQP